MVGIYTQHSIAEKKLPSIRVEKGVQTRIYLDAISHVFLLDIREATYILTL